MRQTGYCPRGPFCAFAHVESKFDPKNTMISAQFNASGKTKQKQIK